MLILFHFECDPKNSGPGKLSYGAVGGQNTSAVETPPQSTLPRKSANFNVAQTMLCLFQALEIRMQRISPNNGKYAVWRI